MTIIDQLNARGQGYLPGLIGIEFISIEPGRLRSRLALRAPNGYLHAAAVIACTTTREFGVSWALANAATLAGVTAR